MSPGGETSRAGLLVAEALGTAPARERLEALRAARVRIAVGPRSAGSRSGQIAAAIATDLVGRLPGLAGAVDVSAPAGVVVQPGVPGLRAGASLASELGARLRVLRPGAPVRAFRAGRRSADPDLALCVGDAEAPRAAAAVWVDARGWVACVGPAPPALAPGDQANPFGALIAAAWGVAELAKHMLRKLEAPGGASRFPLLEKPLAWNLWSHELDSGAPGPALRGSIELGESAAGGVGAIGAAGAVALGAVPGLRGRIELIDDDRVEPTNLERLLTATPRDVGRRKIDVAARALRGTGLAVRRVEARLAEPGASGLRARSALVGVDSGAARRRIAALRLPAVYHGGTQASELLVSRHVGERGPCLACLYPASPQEREAEECGLADLVPELPAAAIGFVSAWCGFLVACEFVKDRVTAAREGALDSGRPVLRIDALAGVPSVEMVEAYVPRRDCACGRAAAPRAGAGQAARRDG